MKKIDWDRVREIEALTLAAAIMGQQTTLIMSARLRKRLYADYNSTIKK